MMQEVLYYVTEEEVADIPATKIQKIKDDTLLVDKPVRNPRGICVGWDYVEVPTIIGTIDGTRHTFYKTKEEAQWGLNRVVNLNIMWSSLCDD